jgi:hypothetical protein
MDGKATEQYQEFLKTLPGIPSVKATEAILQYRLKADPNLAPCLKQHPEPDK